MIKKIIFFTMHHSTVQDLFPKRFFLAQLFIIYLFIFHANYIIWRIVTYK